MNELLTLVELPRADTESPLIVRAALLTLIEIGGDYPGPGQLDAMICDMSQADRTVVVAHDEDETVLAVGDLEQAGQTGEIISVATSVDHRRAGLGRKMVELLEEKSQAGGGRELVLFSMPRARRFWEKLGYQNAGVHTYRKSLDRI